MDVSFCHVNISFRFLTIESGCIDVCNLNAKLENCFVVFVYYISKINNHKDHKGNTKAPLKQSWQLVLFFLLCHSIFVDVVTCHFPSTVSANPFTIFFIVDIISFFLNLSIFIILITHSLL